jgi:asparagine synthetase A
MDGLCKELNLIPVEVPLIVDVESGVNDYLDRDGSRSPVQFHVKNDHGKNPVDAQVVQAATKWKRVALKQFGMKVGEGLVTTCARCARTTSSITTTAPTWTSGTGRESSPPSSGTSTT